MTHAHIMIIKMVKYVFLPLVVEGVIIKQTQIKD